MTRGYGGETRRRLAVMVAAVGSALFLGSRWFAPLRVCEDRPDRAVVCRPLTLEEVAPLGLLVAVLVVPDPAELSIPGVLSVRSRRAAEASSVERAGEGARSGETASSRRPELCGVEVTLGRSRDSELAPGGTSSPYLHNVEQTLRRNLRVLEVLVDTATRGWTSRLLPMSDDDIQVLRSWLSQSHAQIELIYRVCEVNAMDPDLVSATELVRAASTSSRLLMALELRLPDPGLRCTSPALL